MLACFINNYISGCRLSLVCLTSILILLFSKSEAEEIAPELRNINEYFLFVNQDTPIDEVADHLVQLKTYVQSLGYQTPSWDTVIPKVIENSVLNRNESPRGWRDRNVAFIRNTG